MYDQDLCREKRKDLGYLSQEANYSSFHLFVFEGSKLLILKTI